jgi:hypothetical protein
MEAWPGSLVYPFLLSGKAHGTSTKFVITKFLITKFLLDKVRNHKIPKSNEVPNVKNFLIKKMFFAQLFLKA